MAVYASARDSKAARPSHDERRSLMLRRIVGDDHSQERFSIHRSDGHQYKTHSE